MTIFGDDLSSYQDGINVAQIDDPFVICKCTEGTYYTDVDYPTWRQQAASSGKIFVPYHFISAEDPEAQAKHIADKIGDRSLPLMIDFEPAGQYKPTLQQLLGLADACYRAGLHVALAYLPRWYWEQIGSPSLAQLDSRGICLVSSEYPGGTGYPGDNADGWRAYGGMTPLIYQFTNNAPAQGRGVDRNAFRGSAAELAADLTPSGVHMGTYTMSAGWQNDYQDVAAELQKHIPVGTTIDDGDAAAYAMIRSFVAAERAGNISTQLAEVLQLLKQSSAPAPAPVDVNGLAAALVTPLAAALQPHVSGGVDVQALAQAAAEPVAHAVVMELGATLTAAATPAPAAS